MQPRKRGEKIKSSEELKLELAAKCQDQKQSAVRKLKEGIKIRKRFSKLN